MGVVEQSQAVPEPRSSSSGKVSALWLVCQRVPSHPAVSPLLTGGQGRDQITLGKDGTAVPLVLGRLRESKKVFEVLDPLCGHLLGGMNLFIRDKVALVTEIVCHCPRARQPQLWGRALSKLPSQRSHVCHKAQRMLEFAPSV